MIIMITILLAACTHVMARIKEQYDGNGCNESNYGNTDHQHPQNDKDRRNLTQSTEKSFVELQHIDLPPADTSSGRGHGTKYKDNSRNASDFPTMMSKLIAMSKAPK